MLQLQQLCRLLHSIVLIRQDTQNTEMRMCSECAMCEMRKTRAVSFYRRKWIELEEATAATEPTVDQESKSRAKQDSYFGFKKECSVVWQQQLGSRETSQRRRDHDNYT